MSNRRAWITFENLPDNPPEYITINPEQVCSVHKEASGSICIMANGQIYRFTAITAEELTGRLLDTLNADVKPTGGQ